MKGGAAINGLAVGLRGCEAGGLGKMGKTVRQSKPFHATHALVHAATERAELCK